MYSVHSIVEDLNRLISCISYFVFAHDAQFHRSGVQCVSERVEDQRIFGRIGPDSRELVSRERDSRS